MAEWAQIGKISLLQIQTGEMTEEGAYDTAMLLSVETLKLTPDGVFGESKGAWILDRHHRHHPASKYWHPENVLSLGFTSHYETMWRTFHSTPLGIAGENVIVDTEKMVTLEQIGGGFRIETNDGPVHFEGPQVAEPCVEFTRFMTSRPDASAREIKSEREKLRNGVRGFVVGASGSLPVDIHLGDTLLVRGT